MKKIPVLIHTHFHRRKTGLTRSVENIFPFFAATFDSYIYGYGIEGRKIKTSKLLKILFSDQKTIVHCHRNNELIRMLFFRVLGAKLTLFTTRHAATKPSKLTKFLFSKSDKIITLTKDMSADLSLPNVLVNHGVNTGNFIPKSTIKLPNILQKNIISCVGRVREAKGQKSLLQAVAPVLSLHKDWALVIAGKADKLSFLEELQNIVAAHGIEKQVYFLGEVTDIVAVYQASKTVVVPSFTEGFSLVCVEAMSCECTVIATKNVGVHSDVIADAKNGYLFTAGDVTELQTLLLDVINEKKTALGKQAREEVVENWSAKNEAENLIKIYTSV